MLDPSAFNRFLATMGQAVVWRSAIACPCRDEHSGGALPSCPACQGSGYVWSAGVETSLALTGQKIQRAWAAFGQWEQGDVVVTIPSNESVYAISEYDRVLFADSSEPFSRVHVRGRESLYDLPVIGIDRVAVLRGGFLVDLDPPTIGEGNALSWAAGEGPDPGESYTLTGRAHPEYFCYLDFPQDRAHHHGRALPRRVVLRKFDLMGRGR